MPKSVLTTDKDGTKVWRNKNGDLHREDGPAIIWASGDKEWWLNGRRHREDGPAIEWANGKKTWYINGKFYPENSLMVQLLKEKICRNQ
jgi:hypothetical protein